MVMQLTFNNNSIAMSPIGLLWVLFIALRIMEIITWHWFIVVSWPVLVIGVLALLTISGSYILDQYERNLWRGH